jgi:hypothetical protein
MNDTKELSDRIGELYKLATVPLIAILTGGALLLGIWVGAMYILSGGDEQKIKKAKQTLKYIIIGVVIVFAVAGLLPIIIALLQDWTSK